MGMKKKFRQLVKLICQNIIFPFIYFINRWRMVDKSLIVLADAHHENCPPHMMELRQALYKRELNVKEYFFDLEKLSAWEGFKKMVGFMCMYPTCKVVVICDYFLPVASCNKKKKTKVIQLWHSAGVLKKFGFDTKEDLSPNHHGNPFENNDIIVVSGEACVRNYSTAMRAGGRVFPAGVSHTDRLFNQGYIEQCKDKLRYEYPDSAGKKIILWAPTCRDNMSFTPGELHIDNMIAEMKIPIDVYIIKSPHPNMAKGEARMTTDELLACADVLVTDYSSVFFEFLIMDKPIVFFAPDFEEYSATRGLYLDYEDLPGDIITGTDDAEKRLVEAITTALISDPISQRRKIYRSEFMSGCDGYASGRIIDRFIVR